MNRCGMGIHAYRHVSIRTLPDPLGWGPAWAWRLRCKRCRLEQERFRSHYPLIIRTHSWENS